jgi:LacI family transcriptional regulator
MTKQRVTIHDIARELNTTASTVSRALQDHPRISKEMKKMVWELAQKLNYQPNSLASSLRKGKGNTIGVIIPRIDRSFFSSVIRGIEDVAYEAGYNVIICQSYDSVEREKAIVETLINGKVDGVLASIAYETKDFSHFKLVQAKGLPLLFFDRVPSEMEVSKVELDDYMGAFKAVEHLIDQGCRRIVHFSGSPHISIYKNRIEGYKAALNKYGIPFDGNLLFDDVITREKGSEAAIIISQMALRPDGIFSAGDYSALGVIIKLKELGIRIPEDIAVVGYANEFYSEILDPPLSSIDQHSKEMGHSVARLFLEEVSNIHGTVTPKKIILTPDLYIRKSSLRKGL